MRYLEVETVRDPDGIVATITECKDTGYLSYRIQKEFESRGEVKVTNFMGHRHLDAIIRVCKVLRDRLDVHTDRIKIARVRGGSELRSQSTSE